MVGEIALCEVSVTFKEGKTIGKNIFYSIWNFFIFKGKKSEPKGVEKKKQQQKQAESKKQSKQDDHDDFIDDMPVQPKPKDPFEKLPKG